MGPNPTPFASKRKRCPLKVAVQFFALYRERSGVESTSVDLSSQATVGDLVDILRRQFPNLAPSSSHLLVAVNAEYATYDQELHPEDQVALIPPVSGGEAMIQLTDKPLEPQKITASVCKDTNGGVVTFLGTCQSVR